MAIKTARVTVGTSATNLTPSPDAGGSAWAQSVMIRNSSDATSLLVGGSDVTASTGFEVPPGETFTADLEADALFGVVASGSVVVHVLQSGV